jgi:arginyl-tRNA synthetase
MLSVKQELLAALADALEQLSPGAGAKAAFESPKVAAHGDFACTAAMQLAKPLRLNPRQVGEALRAALLALPVYQQWVEAIDIAGAGLHQHPAQARCQAADRDPRGAAGGGRASASRRRAGTQRVMVEFVSANPTGPLHVGHGRQAALGDAICNLYATQGWEVYREFYYNDAGVQIATLTNSTQLRAKGFKPGDDCAQWPEDPASKAFYNGDYIQDIANDFLAEARPCMSDDREFTASGDMRTTCDSIRQFAVAYLRHEQDLDLKAFEVQFDNYYLESSLYTSGKRRRHGATGWTPTARPMSRMARCGCKSTDYGDDKDRVMRKSDGTYTYFVPDVAYHISQVGTRLCQGRQHPGDRPPRDDCARSRRPAGSQCGHPRGLPGLRAAHHGTGDEGRRGGQDLQARRQLRDAARPDRVDQHRRGALLPAQRASPTPNTPSMWIWRCRRTTTTRSITCSTPMRASARCSLPGAGMRPSLDRDRPVAAAQPGGAGADAGSWPSYPDMLTAAAADFAPHDVTFYLRDLAATGYHSYYDAERILVGDETVKSARLALIAATAPRVAQWPEGFGRFERAGDRM